MENGVLQGSVLRVPCSVTVSDVTSVMGHCMHCSLCTDTFCHVLSVTRQNGFNPLMPNDYYSGHTAPLTSKVTLYVFIQQIHVLNILNMVCTLRFFLFKMQFIS